MYAQATRPLRSPTKLLALVVACLVLPAEARAQDETAAVRQEIERINAALVRWYEAGQVDSVAAYMAEDVWQLPPMMEPTVGRAALHSFWTEMTSAGQWSFTLETQDVVVSGPLAAERGTFVVRYTPGAQPPEGLAQPFEDRGNYVVVWRREADGAWRILWDAPVSSAPPAHEPHE